MLTNKQIKAKWLEITKAISAEARWDTLPMAIELVRWVEDHPALAMDLPEVCDCGKEFDDNRRCDFCGAHARY